MKNKPASKKIIRILLLVLTLLFISGFFLKRNPPQFQETKKSQINWRVPNLPDGFNWVESEANQQDIENNKILFNDRFEKNTEEEVTTGEILPPGKIYSVKLTDKDWNYKDAGRATEIIFKQSLEGSGWSSSTRVGNHVVYGMAASGIQGSVIGYVRVEGDLVRTVVLSYFHDGNWVTSENAPSHLQCPCSVNMTIFISEPVSLDEYIPNP